MSVREVPDSISGHTLIIDPDIPGQIGWEALLAMARVAKLVPENGIVVETGSLFGRSSFVWAKNVHPSVRVICIDPWVREDWIIEIVEKRQPGTPPFSMAAWQEYTKDCPNIEAIEGYSPDIVKGKWSEPIDLFFDDGDHDEPGLSNSRDFWIPLVKPGGYFCADEYDVAYPACLRSTYAIASKWATPIDRVGLFSWMQKPTNATS